MHEILVYQSIHKTSESSKTTIEYFLDDIRNGKWQDAILQLRTCKDETKRKALKSRLPNATISGVFESRKDAGLKSHSGFICIDLDHVSDVEAAKRLLSKDPYVYAAMVSCSGNGLAVLFKIKPDRHRDAFQGIDKYLFETYALESDRQCINESRARFVSFDPNLYVNDRAKIFTKYPLKRDQKVKTVKTSIVVKNDFDNIISEIQKRGIDLTNDYYSWINIGFSLASEFGESGRSYFHAISEINSKYKYGQCNRKYTSLLKSSGSGITIGTFYHHIKNYGIPIFSRETMEIIKIAASQKRSGGMNDKAIIENFKAHSDYDHELINEVVPKVTKDTFLEEVSEVELLETEIRTNWDVRRNVISRNLEFKQGSSKWARLEQKHLNGIYILLKRTFKKLSYDLLERILTSDSTPDYNPLHDFINANIDQKPKGNISALSSCITSEYGLTGEDREYFIRKWMVGIISAIYGEHSPLMLVLSGKIQNTGKSEFFRRLLPNELKPYYAESKLDAGKDDEILMTQKLIIMDDELAGKSKRDNQRLKELTSKQTFSLREPYGRNNIDLNRLAVLCATTNVEGILSDPSGNRRIIPINVIGINHKAYNSIDKTALLMEAYHLFKSGYEWRMSKKDIELMADFNCDFEAVSIEEELLLKYFRLPESDDPEGIYFTTTDIKTHIDLRTSHRLNVRELGMILAKNCKKRNFTDQRGKRTKGWALIKKEDYEANKIGQIPSDYRDQEEINNDLQRQNACPF